MKTTSTATTVDPSGGEILRFWFLRHPVSGLSHLAGALVAAYAAIVLIQEAAVSRTIWHVIAFSIFGSSLVLLFLSSALYHILPLSARGLARLRKLDHSMIYVSIAGSYTPFCLIPLREGTWMGWTMLSVVWAIALMGITLKLFWLESSRWVRIGLYFGMGWVCLIAFPRLWHVLSKEGLAWFFAEGAAYILGSVVYATKWPRFFPKVFSFHEVWHCFVLLGSFCHYKVLRDYVFYL